MSSINLVHRYVVEQILSITSKCEFKNYGGTSSGLIDRVMASFHIPETGHIQTFYYGKVNKRLNTTAIKTFIKTKIITDQLDDVIDIWKEICNKGFSESMVMGYASDIELVLITRGLSSNQFLNLAVPTFSTKLKTVDNAIKSASDYLEKVIESKTAAEFNNYKEKLLRTLATYPYIQKVFIENNFPESFLGQLEAMPNATLRFSALITKIKEDNIACLKEVKAKEAKEGTRKMSEAMKRMHPPAEPYVQFMGTDHLTAPVFNWVPDFSRLAQECSLIGGLMGSLRNGDKSVISTIKALIHRSSNQKVLCRDILILPSAFSDFDSYDRRKRGMILDEILNKVGETPKAQVTKDPLSSFPEYPNLTEEEEHVSQPKANVPDEQEESTYLKLIKTVHPEVYEIIVATEANLGLKLPHEEIEEILKNYLADKPALKRSSFHYELPESQREKVIIKGDPSDPVVKKLAEMFRIDLKDVKPSETDSPLEPTSPLIVATINKMVKEFEDDPAFKSRLIRNLGKQRTGLDRVDDFLNAVANEASANPKLLHALAIQEARHKNGTCDNPDWTMCGEKNADIIQNFLKTKYPAVELIVGIMPDRDKPTTSYTRPDAGKQRSEGQHDFSKLFKFLSDRYDPEPKKPTATEIETSTTVVVNQKFVIYDVKGEFFCEYKMKWTPTTTQFMFTHDEPDNKTGRRFHLIHKFDKPMTQDEASAKFQSLRRVAISNGPHKQK